MGSPKVSTEDTGRKAATEFLEAVECGGCVDKYIQVFFYYNMIIFFIEHGKPSDFFLARELLTCLLFLNVVRILIIMPNVVRMLIIMLNINRMLIIMPKLLEY